ncbi:MAG: hypothetical protein M1118_09775 [Chloroflexi bacterium]|nr:hypothetical protein [Chloroflexota bacterium]
MLHYIGTPQTLYEERLREARESHQYTQAIRTRRNSAKASGQSKGNISIFRRLAGAKRRAA